MKTNHRLPMILSLLLLAAGAQEASAFYNPQTGRWLSRDPVLELKLVGPVPGGNSRIIPDANLFSFARNAPINLIDSFGLYVISGTCTRDQKDQIQKTIRNACSRAKKCAQGCSAGTPSFSVRSLCDSPNASEPVINCTDKNDKGQKCTSCGYAIPGSETINLCPLSFDPAEQNPFGCKLSCVIFHEENHANRQGPLDHGEDMKMFDQCMGCRR
jgi:hypothetical protein